MNIPEVHREVVPAAKSITRLAPRTVHIGTKEVVAMIVWWIGTRSSCWMLPAALVPRLEHHR